MTSPNRDLLGWPVPIAIFVHWQGCCLGTTIYSSLGHAGPMTWGNIEGCFSPKDCCNRLYSRLKAWAEGPPCIFLPHFDPNRSLSNFMGKAQPREKGNCFRGHCPRLEENCKHGELFIYYPQSKIPKICICKIKALQGFPATRVIQPTSMSDQICHSLCYHLSPPPTLHFIFQTHRIA